METTVAQFLQDFGRYENEPVCEPVIVKDHDNIVGVFISADDYTRFHRAARKAGRAGELPPEMAEALRTAQYPSEEELRALGL